MKSMVGKLMLICKCILFANGLVDPEGNYYHEPFNKLNQKEEILDLNSDFAGKEFWEDIDQKLCDDPEFDETWKKPESLCYSVSRGSEETRIEVVSWSPPLVIYRKFFTDEQIDCYLRIFEKGYLEKTTVVSSDGTSQSSNVRVAKGLLTSASDYPEAHSLLVTASRLIPAINFTSSEPMMGLKYDIKGHYVPHYDYLDVSGMTEDDNRMVTFLMVFQAANVGGGTIFPFMRTVVRTRPGDAILWFNMKQNTEKEPLSFHGGCPVHSGEKIVSTIWVERRGQALLNTYNNKSFSADVLLS